MPRAEELEESPQKRLRREGSDASGRKLEEALGLDEFAQWTKGFAGVPSCGLIFRPCEFGIGAFAGRAMSPGEMVFHLPFSHCITAKTVDCEPEFNARIAAGLKALEQTPVVTSDSVIQSLGPWLLPTRVRLWLYLIHGRLDIRSPHHAYLCLCPSEYDDPFWWSEEELAELSGSNLLAALRHEQQLMAQRFDLHVKPLTIACPELFPPDVFSLQGLVWARSLWASRAFPVFLASEYRGGFVSLDDDDGTGGALLPGIDFFNHKQGADMEWWIGRAGTGVELRLPSDAPRTTAAGEQLWINYGPKPDEEWLFNYGFLLHNNITHNRVELVLLCEGPIRLMRKAARIVALLNSEAVFARGEDSPFATLHAGPFFLRDVSIKLQLPEALVAVVSFLIGALSDQPTVRPEHWLADAFERQCAALRNPTEDAAPPRTSLRQSKRLACAHAYIASQRMILKNASAYLRSLTEQDAGHIFGFPSLATDQSYEQLAAEEKSNCQLRLAFAEEDCAKAGREGDIYTDAVGSSSDESEGGSDSDVDEGLLPRGNDGTSVGSDAGEFEDAGNPTRAHANKIAGTASDHHEQKEFVLVGDGCAVRMTFAT